MSVNYPFNVSIAHAYKVSGKSRIIYACVPAAFMDLKEGMSIADQFHGADPGGTNLIYKDFLNGLYSKIGKG
jgi:hypothetical protein